MDKSNGHGLEIMGMGNGRTAEVPRRHCIDGFYCSRSKIDGDGGLIPNDDTLTYKVSLLY